jgi:hypothetical protein
LVASGETPNDFTVLPNDNEILRPLASATEMADKLIMVHDNRDDASAKADAAYSWVTSNLIWESHIVPMWDDLIMKAVVDWSRKSESKNTVIAAEDL